MKIKAHSAKEFIYSRISKLSTQRALKDMKIKAHIAQITQPKGTVRDLPKRFLRI